MQHRQTNRAKRMYDKGRPRFLMHETNVAIETATKTWAFYVVCRRGKYPRTYLARLSAS